MDYPQLLLLHSYSRWSVVLALPVVWLLLYVHHRNQQPFGSTQRRMRALAVGLVHLQVLIGLGLFFVSPVVKAFWAEPNAYWNLWDVSFFGIVHPVVMLSLSVVVSVGSSLSKRAQTPQQSYRTLLWWFGLAILLLVVFIPWPFSFWTARPLFR